MGSDIILCMALIASFAFVIQFLLSILGSDLDTDIDIDSASDLSMSLSDIISFKGITHFILGYSWTTYFSGSHLVGVVIGSFFFMVNQWKEIAGEQVKAFEHINLGNITVFDGGQNSTGNFLNNVVKAVAPALGVIDQLPIADTLKKLKGDDKK